MYFASINYDYSGQISYNIIINKYFWDISHIMQPNLSVTLLYESI